MAQKVKKGQSALTKKKSGVKDGVKEKKKPALSAQTLSEEKATTKSQDTKSESDVELASPATKAVVKSQSSSKKSESKKVKKDTSAEKDQLSSEVSSLSDSIATKKPAVDEEKSS